MTLKLICCLIALASVLIPDWKRISKISWQVRFCYFAMILYFLYCAGGYILNRPFPNIQDAVNHVFAKPAKAVDTSLKVSPQTEASDKRAASSDED